MQSLQVRALRITEAGLIVFGLCALMLLASAPALWLPAEDAVILFHYSRNLALHGAITFNASGPPVEGATDFLWMMLLAAAERLAVPPYTSVAALNLLSLTGLAAMLQHLSGRRLTPRGTLAVVGAAALIPQFLAALSGFSTLPFACVLVALTLAVLRRRVWAASLLALLLCLLRPDGVVFAGPLLLWLFFSAERRRSLLTPIAIAFAAPGTAYFLWRWRYFHELFPLPFLVKADTPRVLGLIVTRSVHQSLLGCLFVALVLAGVLSERQTSAALQRPTLLLTLCLAVVPTLFYAGVRLDQNVAGRFFFYLPVTAALLLALHWKTANRSRLLAFTLTGWAVCYAAPLLREVRTFRDLQFDTIHEIGQQMDSQMGRPARPPTLLTTEAGFLPYDSSWPSIDAWGLNTPRFAHHFIQPGDVARLAPDLIVIHPDLQDSCLPDPAHPEAFTGRSWPHMTHNLVQAAAAGGYELWLVSYGSDFYRMRRHWQYGEGDRECWYIKPDTPAHDRLAKILLEHHAVPPGPSQTLEASHPASLRR